MVLLKPGGILFSAYKTCNCANPDCANRKEGAIVLTWTEHTPVGPITYQMVLPASAARAVRASLTESLAALADAHKET
jgi:hypothetical protein